MAVKLSAGISACKTPLCESYTRISDKTVGREIAGFLVLRRAILIETVRCPRTCAGIKNIETPPGTASHVRSGFTASPVASFTYASLTSPTAFEKGRIFLTSSSVTRSK
jgi:hypothetical protein